MRRVYLPSIYIFLCAFLLLPVNKAGGRSSNHNKVFSILSNHLAAASNVEHFGKLLYDSLHLNKLGLKKEALLYAYKGQQRLVKKGMINNYEVLTVCDFTQPSSAKRMYIIDVRNFKVLLNTYVAHGRNSGLNYAQKFSNSPSSLKSSLGFYVTRNTYYGEHGLSLRLAGLEKGINDKAAARAIVVHGANYIGSEWLGANYMGRSFGCPAVPAHIAPKVINLIKEGTCLFIYHPLKRYLHGSKILNG